MIDEYPVISPDAEEQARYVRCREGGCTHGLAMVLATRRFPGVRTDSEFNKGRCNGNQFEGCPALGDHHRRLAEAAGVSTTGKYYQHSLADFPGDPRAWVSSRGDVAAVAASKGFRVSGAVTYEPPEREPCPDVLIDPAIVERDVQAALAESPGARREDVYDRVYRLRAGLEDPNPLLVQDPVEAW